MRTLTGFLAGIVLFTMCAATDINGPSSTRPEARVQVKWYSLNVCSGTSVYILYNSNVVSVLQRPGDADTISIPAGDSVQVKYIYSCNSKTYQSKYVVVSDTVDISL
jgi:hypothetical protein